MTSKTAPKRFFLVMGEARGHGQFSILFWTVAAQVLKSRGASRNVVGWHNLPQGCQNMGGHGMGSKN